MKLINIIIFILIFGWCETGFSQSNKSSIRVIDGELKDPIPFAHICFESFDRKEIVNSVTDMDGTVSILISKPGKVAISAVGFETKIDSLQPGRLVEYMLTASVYSVDEVVVTGQYSPKPIDQSIYKVEVLSNKLVDRKAVSNLNDLLSNELNFSPSRDAALGSSVKMQGLGGEHVKILVDGVPVAGRQNGILDLSQINVSNIDHIETINGPMSVVYGSNALGGVINIITKKESDNFLSGSVNSYVESVGVYDFNGNLNLGIKKHYFGITAKRYFFDGWSAQKHYRSNDWKPKLEYNFDGFYSYKTNNFNLRYNYSYYDKQLRDLNEPNFYTGSVIDFYHFNNRQDQKINTSIKFPIIKSNLELTGSYSTYKILKDEVSTDLEILESSSQRTSETLNTSWFGNMIFSMEKLEKLNFQIGSEVKNEHIIGDKISVGEKEITEVSGFGTLQYSPFKGLTLQPGLRLGYHSLFDRPMNYSLNVMYKWNQYSYRFSMARGDRTPSMQELYYEFIDNAHHVVGNAELVPEMGKSYNFWVDRVFSRSLSNYSTEVNLYYNQIDHKITMLLDADDPTFGQYFNVPAEYYVSTGATVKLKYRFHPRLSIDPGVTYNALQYKGLTRYTHTFDYNLTTMYQNVKYGFDLSLFIKRNGPSENFSADLQDLQNISKEDFTISKRDGYTNIDLTFSYPFLYKRLVVTSGVKNLMNIQTIGLSGSGGGSHSGGNGYQANWGRSYFIRATWNFRKHKV